MFIMVLIHLLVQKFTNSFAFIFLNKNFISKKTTFTLCLFSNCAWLNSGKRYRLLPWLTKANTVLTVSLAIGAIF